MTDNKIIMYSTPLCPDCIRAKMWLDTNKIPYKDINIENDEKTIEIVTSLNKGMRRVPTIIFPDGSVLAEPTNEELEEKFKT